MSNARTNDPKGQTDKTDIQSGFAKKYNSMTFGQKIQVTAMMLPFFVASFLLVWTYKFIVWSFKGVIKGIKLWREAHQHAPAPQAATAQTAQAANQNEVAGSPQTSTTAA